MQKPHFAFRAALPRFIAVVLYAVAMAFLESATVLYLRTIYGGIDPVGPRRTPFDPLPDFLWVEVGREMATIVMLIAVGWLAGRGTAGRIGGFVAAFGVWDVFYYLFLWLFAGWPASLFAPDILFLIPLPWWGPVIAPMLIALVMVIGGGLALAREAGDGLPVPGPFEWILVVVGALLCLGAFMADALLTLPRSLEAAVMVREGSFPWGVYGSGLALGVIGLARTLTHPQRDTPPERGV